MVQSVYVVAQLCETMNVSTSRNPENILQFEKHFVPAD
jgi:hypothetical protein